MSTPKPSGTSSGDVDTPVLRNRNEYNGSNSPIGPKDNDSDYTSIATDKGYLQSILKNSRSTATGNNSSSRPKVNFSPVKQIVSYHDDLDVHENVFCEKPKAQVPPPQDGSVTSWWLSNPSVPYTLSLYLQLACNALLSLGIILLAYIMYRGIRSDVDHRIDLYTTDVMIEISHCSRDYYRNKCDGPKRPPALENSCDQWAKCMNRDPRQIGTAKITAEAFGDIVNAFVATISWKFVVIVVAFFLGGLGFTNRAFSSYRHSLSLHHQQALADRNQMNQLQVEAHEHRETEARLRTQIEALEKERDRTPNIQSAHSLFLAQASSNAFDMSPLLHRNRP